MTDLSYIPVSEVTLKSVEGDVSGLEGLAADFQAGSARINADTRLTPSAKQADIAPLTAKFEEALIPKREAAKTRLADVLATLEDEEAELRDAARIQPRAVPEWQEANARALFIREDAERLAVTRPDELVAWYKRAVKVDRVGAFLLARYGLDALEKAKETRVLVALTVAIAEAEAMDPAKLGKIGAARKRLTGLSGRIANIRTPAEDRELSAVYGVRIGR